MESNRKVSPGRERDEHVDNNVDNNEFPEQDRHRIKKQNKKDTE